MAYQFTAREEFLVNTQTESFQSYGDITALDTGGFIAVWVDSSNNPDGTYADIHAQIFDASGAKTGSEIIVNTRTENRQTEPHVTVLSNGNFVVSWRDADGMYGEETDIKAQIFTPSGTKVGGEFLVNTITYEAQAAPSITALADGGFVVTWQDLSETQFEAFNWVIKAQVFSAEGAKVGNEFKVNTRYTDSDVDPDVTALENGGFVITWGDSSGPPEEYGDIQARIFSATGTPAGNQFRFNTSVYETQDRPSIAGLTGGGFVAVWEDWGVDLGGAYGPGVVAQIFTEAGTATGSPILVKAEYLGWVPTPDVAALENGGFVVTWQDSGGDGGDSDGAAILAKVFDADGNPVGDAFLVNQNTAGAQFSPTVSGLRGGGFVIEWTDYSGTLGDSSNSSIKARIFAPDPTEDDDFLTGTLGADSIEALGGDDTVDGAGGHDILSGGDGADSLFGGLLNDLLVGDDGNDSLYGGADIDTLRGEAGDDLLSGGAGGDSLNGGAGNDTLLGGERWDSLVGGQGNDWLDGGIDNDQMFGLAGDDTYVVDHVGDRVYEVPDEGNDTVRSSIDFALTPNVENLILTGGAVSGTGNGLSNSIEGTSGNNVLTGGLGNDSLYGWDGNDSLVGGNDHDRLSGGNGNDTLTGGHGNDVLGGGAGADDFVFSSVAVNGHDHVVDFVHGIDRLVFSASDYGFASGHVLTAAEFTQGSAAMGASAQFVWDAAGQRLYWDADGDGAGAAFELALISNGAVLTKDDLVFA